MAEQVGLRAYNPVEVPLGERVFESVDLTEHAEKEFGEIFAELGTIADSYVDGEGEAIEKPKEEEDADDARVRELILKGFDLLLRPQDGSQAKPSTWLKKSLANETVTPRQFNLLWQEVLLAIARANSRDEEGDATRPT